MHIDYNPAARAVRTGCWREADKSSDGADLCRGGHNRPARLRGRAGGKGALGCTKQHGAGQYRNCGASQLGNCGPDTYNPAARGSQKALEFGFRPEVVKGIPVFCKEVPIDGTRFTNKRCVREDQFSAFLSQLQVARDAAMRNGCYGADFCGNVQSMTSKPRMSMGSSR